MNQKMINKKSVYLAGGFQSDWQDQVINACPQFKFNDPRSHNIQSPSDYTEWDLKAVSESDYIFAYMEDSNPGGYALALEIGYAKALNKKVIFVEEYLSDNRNHRFNMVRACADISKTSLSDGITALNTLDK